MEHKHYHGPRTADHRTGFSPIGHPGALKYHGESWGSFIMEFFDVDKFMKELNTYQKNKLNEISEKVIKEYLFSDFQSVSIPGMLIPNFTQNIPDMFESISFAVKQPTTPSNFWQYFSIKYPNLYFSVWQHNKNNPQIFQDIENIKKFSEEYKINIFEYLNDLWAAYQNIILHYCFELFYEEVSKEIIRRKRPIESAVKQICAEKMPITDEFREAIQNDLKRLQTQVNKKVRESAIKDIRQKFDTDFKKAGFELPKETRYKDPSQNPIWNELIFKIYNDLYSNMGDKFSKEKIYQIIQLLISSFFPKMFKDLKKEHVKRRITYIQSKTKNSTNTSSL